MKRLLIVTLCVALLLCGCAGGKKPVGSGGTTTAATTTAPTATPTTAPQSEKFEIGYYTFTLDGVKFEADDPIDKFWTHFGKPKRTWITVTDTTYNYCIYYYYEHVVLETWADRDADKLLDPVDTSQDPFTIENQRFGALWVLDNHYVFDNVSVGSSEAEVYEKIRDVQHFESRIHRGPGIESGPYYECSEEKRGNRRVYWDFIFDNEDKEISTDKWRDGDRFYADSKVKAIYIGTSQVSY